MRATIAAASPRMRIGSPTASVAEKPMIGASRMRADAGEHAGDDPRDRRDPAHRDAEQPRARHVLRRGAQRDAVRRVAEEQRTSASASSGPATSAMKCCGQSTTRPNSTGVEVEREREEVGAAGEDRVARRRFAASGARAGATMISCATPIVAMSTISRGLLNSRRRTCARSSARERARRREAAAAARASS